jgi:hypothetical protein
MVAGLDGYDARWDRAGLLVGIPRVNREGKIRNRSLRHEQKRRANQGKPEKNTVAVDVRCCLHNESGCLFNRLLKKDCT